MALVKLPFLVSVLGVLTLGCSGGEDASTASTASGSKPAEPASAAPATAQPDAPLAEPSSTPLRTLDLGDALLVDILREGAGRVVRGTSAVALHYEGRVEDAEEPFVRTRDRTGPERHELDPASNRRPIEGLARALIGLAQGTIARIHVPGHLAYGLEGAPNAGIEAHADLVFEVEIIEVR